MHVEKVLLYEVVQDRAAWDVQTTLHLEELQVLRRNAWQITDGKERIVGIYHV